MARLLRFQINDSDSELLKYINMLQIKFYKPSDPYGEFSNFSLHSIYLDGKNWPTVEHYFQAQKFLNTPHEEAIRHLKKPMDARIHGQDRNKPLREDWEKVKNDVMEKAVFAKFSQHEALKKILLSTENSFLIEHTKNDSYWGDGKSGKGRNMLGHILMKVREQLKS